MLGVSRGKGVDQWALPGGHLEPGESFLQGARRELFEETNLRLGAAREVHRAPSTDGTLTAAFVGDVEGEPVPGDEGDLAWLSPEDLSDPARSPFASYAKDLFAKMSMLDALAKIDPATQVPEFGAVVPRGGSSCANCRSLVDKANLPHCDNQAFISFRTPGKVGSVERIPAPSDDPARYCCNAWHQAHGVKLVALDLGVADVHVDSVPSTPRKKTMAEITAAKRKALPSSSFADPKNRRYPIGDATHTRNAAARLEQNKANEPQYAAIKARIAAAAKKFGIDSQYNRPARRGFKMGGNGFRLSIDHPTKGRIEVRHMTDVKAPGVELEEVQLADEPKKPVWIQLARPGRFYKDGAFVLDDKVFGDIIRNFNETANQAVPVDFEHATEMAASAGTIPMLGAPAQGWIKRVEMRGDNLFGLVEWNDLARDYIRAGQYKFISPAIRFDARDRTTGKNVGAKLTSAALTNKPFLDGMRAVAASDTSTNGVVVSDSDLAGNRMIEVADESGHLFSAYSTSEYMPQLRACLKLGELDGPSVAKARLGQLREHLFAAGGDHSATPQGVPLSSYLVPLREMARAPMGASWDDVFDVMDDLIDAAIDEHEIAYHGGEAPEEMSASDDEALDDEETMTATTPAAVAATEEDTPMTIEANKDLTAQLTDAKAQALVLTERAAKVETEHAALTLKLKDAEAKGTEALARVAALEAECKTLKDQVATTEAKRLSDRVDGAFAAYKDSQKLSDAHKKAMLITLRDDPALFDELYPAVDPAKAHLLRDVTTGPGAKPPVTAPASVQVPDMKELTAKLMKDGQSLEDATSNAYAQISKMLRSPQLVPAA